MSTPTSYYPPVSSQSTRNRGSATPIGTPGQPVLSLNQDLLAPAPTRTGNPIGRPSNALLAARQQQAEMAIQQGLPPPQHHTARTMPRASMTRQSSTPVPPAPAPMPTQMKVYHRINALPEGPLPLYTTPPGQPTYDSSLLAPARSQAMYSTYPSRLRTGVTSMVQPEIITGGPREREAFLAEYEREMGGKPGSGVSTPRFDSPAPRSTFRPAVTGRRGRTVNYVDKGSDEDSDSSLSELGSEDEDSGKRARKRDQPLDVQSMQRLSRLKRKKDEMDKGWTWLGDRTPADKVSSSYVKGPKHRYYSEEQLEQADQPEVLIPITIDLDVAGRNAEQGNIKIRDRFLWNVNDTLLDPQAFAATFVSDLTIPSENTGIIAELIRTQIEEAQSLVSVNIADKEASEAEITFQEEDEDKDEGVAEDEAIDWKEADCRVILNLDLQISTQILRDRIEWDLSSTLPPSQFAAAYARDLGLSGEAIPLIAHAITEEIHRHKKDALDLRLFRATHPTEQAKWEKSLGGVPRVNNRTGAKELKGVWRDWFEREEFGPVLMDLSLEEMERREVERNREQRRIMRGMLGKRRR